MKKLPFKAAIAFVASPQGRRAINKARAKLDTPQNRERARAAFAAAKKRVSARTARPASASR